ncbi:MAG: M14 metallopeptidase family protein, partial [Pseudomonadota bacterium]
MFRRFLAAVALAVALPVASNAQSSVEFFPNADYDPTVPDFASVLGYSPGERITWTHEARRYFEALRDASPDRVAIVDYGQSWQGRGLFYVVISSAENMRRTDEIKANMQRLADPRRTTSAEAASIIENQPAVTWLSYSVHGNELSPTDSAMLTAYHLLASRGDERVQPILRDTVVVIVPVQNPDGRDRFVHQFETALGLEADADRIAAEHNEPWPGGRVNHYLFDLNRDWFIRTQPETRAHADALREWLPVAFVDSHEMGSDQTYYFSPEAVPYNPHLAQDQRDSLTLFGRTNAAWFDRFGIDYFTREIFDAFYPGYGASWPSYFGSIAMTYEQGSTRGLKVRQYDGNVVTYAETVQSTFLTSLGTAETVSANREKLLNDFYQYQESAIEEGRSDDVRAYVIPAQADQAGADKLAGLLVQQGVEVGRATSAFTACGNRFPAGSYVINLDQPAKRLLRNLMDEDVPLESDFLAEQERRRAKNLADEIYDVTGWSLPLMLNVDAEACSRRVAGDFAAVGPELVQPGIVEGGSAQVAYLVPWGTRPAVRLLARALRAGLNVKSSDLPFTNGGTRYPAGTLIIDVADNPGDLSATVARLARETGANAVAVNDSWVTEGPSFGSGNVVRFSAPKIAIAWDRPTNNYNAGSTRFIIERQFDYPVTAIRTRQLASADLSQYQVLILPATSGGD